MPVRTRAQLRNDLSTLTCAIVQAMERRKFEGAERKAGVRGILRAEGFRQGGRWQNIDCIELIQIRNHQWGGHLQWIRSTEPKNVSGVQNPLDTRHIEMDSLPVALCELNGNTFESTSGPWTHCQIARKVWTAPSEEIRFGERGAGDTPP